MEVDMNRQLLEQLIAFEQYGTLAEVAEHLLITQPTVTRGMRKLEEELEVVLFDRKPNKIELTETGLLAVQEAKKLLQDENEHVNSDNRGQRLHGAGDGEGRGEHNHADDNDLDESARQEVPADPRGEP